MEPNNLKTFRNSKVLTEQIHRTMASTRLLSSSRPMNLGLASSSSSSSSLSGKTVRCLSKAGFNGEKIVSGNGEKKSMAVALKGASVAASDRIVTSAPGMSRVILDLASLVVANVRHAAALLVRTAVKQKRRKLFVQMFIEKVGQSLPFLSIKATVYRSFMSFYVRVLG